MKFIKVFVLLLAFACVAAVPAAPVAQAATVARPDPSGQGYSPCQCICIKIGGHDWCLCACDNS